MPGSDFMSHGIFLDTSSSHLVWSKHIFLMSCQQCKMLLTCSFSTRSSVVRMFTQKIE